MSRKDPVTSEVRWQVLSRDQGCVAQRLGFAHICRDQWGTGHPADDVIRMTLDHVQEGGGRMGKRAPSDVAHLVTLCYFAHVSSGWATSHRPELRAYIEEETK